MLRECELGLSELHQKAQARFKTNNPLSNLTIPKLVSSMMLVQKLARDKLSPTQKSLQIFFLVIDVENPNTLKFLKAPLIRYEQKQKDIDESWETETLITTFDLDEIETEIEVDYWVRLNWDGPIELIWTEAVRECLNRFKHNHPNEEFDLDLADLDDLGLTGDETLAEKNSPKAGFKIETLSSC